MFDTISYLQESLNYTTKTSIDEKDKLQRLLKDVYGYSYKHWSPELHKIMINIVEYSIVYQRNIYNDIDYYNYITRKTDKQSYFNKVVVLLLERLNQLLNDGFSVGLYTQKAKYILYSCECWGIVLDIMDITKENNELLFCYIIKSIYDTCKLYNLLYIFYEYCNKASRVRKTNNTLSLFYKQLEVATYFRESTIIKRTISDIEYIKNTFNIPHTFNYYNNLEYLKTVNYVSTYPIKHDAIISFEELGITNSSQLIDFIESNKYNSIDIKINPIKKTLSLCSLKKCIDNTHIYQQNKYLLIQEVKRRLEENSIQLRYTQQSKQREQERIEAENLKHQKIIKEKLIRDNKIKAELEELKKVESLKEILKKELDDSDELDQHNNEEDVLIKAQLLLKRQKENERVEYLNQWNEKNWSTKLSYINTLPKLYKVKERHAQDFVKVQQNIQIESQNKWELLNEKKEKLVSFNIPKGRLQTSQDIIVYGLPIIDKSKESKLIGVIKKKIKERIAIIDIDIKLVFEKEESKEFAFLSHSNALEISKALDNLMFDRKHVLHTIYGKMIEELLNMTQVHTPKPTIAVINFNIEPYDHITEDACNTFICTTGKELIKYTNMYQTFGQKDAVIEESNTSNESLFTSFDKDGIYMYSIFKDKVVLYTGRDLDVFSYFELTDIKKVIFSSNSNYIAMYDGYRIFIYNISLHELKYKITKCSISFNFSMSEKYFIHYNNEKLDIINLHSSTTLHIDKVKSWNIDYHSDTLVYFIQDEGSRPGFINTIDLDNIKDTLLTKPIYKVTDVSFVMNPFKNEFISILKRNDSSYMFKCFDLDALSTNELNINVQCIDLQWIPETFDISLITKDFKFATMKQSSDKITYTDIKKPIKQMFWSPDGKFVVLTNLLENEDIILYDITKKSVIKTIQRRYTTNINWDPSGRFFVVNTTDTFSNKGNGYYIYTFQGDLIHEQSFSKLTGFVWRPVPKNLVTHKSFILEIVKGNKKNTKLSKLLKNIKSDESKLLLTSNSDVVNKRIERLQAYYSIIN